MNTRMEHDTMGSIAVPADRHWGAQTQRSLENFRIGGQRQPREIITAFAYLKEACALATEFTWRTIETTFEKSPDHRFGPKFECHLPWLGEKMEELRKNHP